MANKSTTTINQLIHLLDKSTQDPKELDKLANTLLKLFPTKTKRKTIMADTNLNKTFRIKRINYSVIATITEVNDNLYRAKILSVEGQSFNKAGDELSISKRELQLTGHPTSSKS